MLFTGDLTSYTDNESGGKARQNKGSAPPGKPQLPTEVKLINEPTLFDIDLQVEKVQFNFVFFYLFIYPLFFRINYLSISKR